ncbi:MAG TPA: transposase [Defluviitoga tunisiensis]|nr:transposase [Defluviitoga tunisiensis]HPP10166.1 transposase [Defluviitoga tunisiensis]
MEEYPIWNYTSKNARITKTGNQYLRYYLIEAANGVIRCIPEYKNYYCEKLKEPANHKHKRTFVFTARKLVSLIFGLLVKN